MDPEAQATYLNTVCWPCFIFCGLPFQTDSPKLIAKIAPGNLKLIESLCLEILEKSGHLSPVVSEKLSVPSGRLSWAWLALHDSPRINPFGSGPSQLARYE